MEIKKYKDQIKAKHLEKLKEMKEERDVIRYIENLPFEVHGVEEQKYGFKGSERRELTLYTTDYSIMDNYKSTLRDYVDDAPNDLGPYERPRDYMTFWKKTYALEFYTDIDENTKVILDNPEIKGNIDVLKSHLWTKRSGHHLNEVIDDETRINFLKERGIKDSLLEKLREELPKLKE